MRAAFACAVVLAACTSGELAIHPTTAPVLGAGRFTLALNEAARSLVLARDGKPLVTLDAASFQLGLAAADPEASWDPFELEGSAAVRYVSPTSWKVEWDDTSAVATIRLDYGAGVAAHVSVVAASASRFTLTFVPDTADGPVVARVAVRTTDGDSFYGTGAAADRVEQRGAFRPMQADSAGDPHAPIPLVVATRGWGLFASSRRVGALDVARRDPRTVEATFAVAPLASGQPDPLRVDLIGGDTALDVYGEYGAVASVPVAPPLHGFGPWFWRSDATAAKLVADAQELRELDLAFSGLGTSTSAATALGAFDFDPARYPDPAALVAALRGAGLHAGIWSAPYSSLAGAASYLPPRAGRLANPWNLAPIDFTNPDAAAFWRGLVHHYAAAGFDAFALDGGEDVVPSVAGRRTDWSFAVDADERTVHQRYPGLLHGVYVDGVTGQDPTQPPIANAAPPVLFVRSARWGEDRGSILRLPGSLGSFADLARAVTATVSLSASGIPFASFDVGAADQELRARAIEASALFPIMSLVDTAGTPPWNGLLQTVGTYTRLHLQLLPFFWTYAQKIARAPIVRPVGFLDPARTESDVFAVGDELLVAPVLTAGATTRTVTLPAGRWYDWSDGLPYEGTAVVASPLITLPLFLREGAIVPLLRPTIDTIARAVGTQSFDDDPGQIYAMIAPGPAREFVLYDGARIARNADGTLATSDGTTFHEGFVLELVAASKPTAVTLDGAPWTTWSWSAESNGTLYVTVPAGTHTVALSP